MASLLVVYTSTHGHTGKIAARIAHRLDAAGHQVTLTGQPERTDPCPRDYDVVIAGASVHAGKHQAELAGWALDHAVALNMLPSAFFSVCLAVADDAPRSQAAAHGYLEDFEETARAGCRGCGRRSPAPSSTASTASRPGSRCGR